MRTSGCGRGTTKKRNLANSSQLFAPNSFLFESLLTPSLHLAFILLLMVVKPQAVSPNSFPSRYKTKDFISNCGQQAVSVGRILRVGAVFTESDIKARKAIAFEAALSLVNEHLLLTDSQFCVSLKKIIVRSNSSFKVSKSVCSSLIRNGFHVIIGPSDKGISSHVRSICNALDIPHISISPEMRRSQDDQLQAGKAFGGDQFSINVHPSLEEFHAALGDFFAFANWTKVALLFPPGKARFMYRLQDYLLSNGLDCLAIKFVPSEGSESKESSP